MASRPDWPTYFLGVAQAVAARADCQKARFGAVIVDQDHRIVSTGYNGSPPGDPRSCLDGDCPRATSGAQPNTGSYGDCISLHAEQNAIVYADWKRTQGATIYLWGTREDNSPCPMCAKLIVAAGIAHVISS